MNVNEVLFIESSFNIDMMEADLSYRDRMNALNIKLLEESVDEDYFVENVVDTVRIFFENIIEKIKEMVDKMGDIIAEKYQNAKFKSELMKFQSKWAKYKSSQSNKNIKIFDYVNYYKDCKNAVQSCLKSIDPRDLSNIKTIDKLNSYIDESVAALKRAQSIARIHLLDSAKNFSKNDNIWGASLYVLRLHNFNALQDIEKEYDEMIKYREMYKELAKKTITDSIDRLKKESMKEAKKSKEDPKYVSKIPIYKRFASILSNLSSKIMQGINHAFAFLFGIFHSNAD